MSTNFITAPGEHRIQLFIKTETTHTGQATYSVLAKEAIASQFYSLLRDEAYNQTRVTRVLAKAHNVAPATILNWVKLYGGTLSTPTPKVGEIKPKIKPVDKSVSDSIVTELVNKVADVTVLDKMIQLLKSIPVVDITISIRPIK